MYRIIFLNLFVTLLLSCSSSNQHYTHHDVDNEEISRFVFKQHLSTRNYLEVTLDSLNQKRLIERHSTGEVRDLDVLHSRLATSIYPEEIDFTKPIIIIYYPGKDPCNASATKDRNQLKNTTSQLKQGILQNNGNPPLYIYKEKEGLEKYNDIIKWRKDEDQFI